MSKKVMLATIAMAMLVGGVAVSAPVALANGDENALTRVWVDGVGWVGCFADGRLNDCDLDVPVAIFYSRESIQLVDEYGDPVWNEDGTQVWQEVITGIELWGFAAGYESPIKVIEISASDIQAQIAASGGADTLLAQGYGYSLGYSASGYFWVTAPNGYSFAWEDSSLLG